ncbi:hypothetical protein GCM10022254_37730 [Actinomadura meridiana]|uniref:Uncharacterized protein n=1 Tax=Actinomadura meridiana TaxID=559626 RepID=A0ABP8C5B4_9ACTN
MPIRIPATPTTDRQATHHHPALGGHPAPTTPARFSDDDMLLLLLISTWELYTARPALPSPPTEMTEQELIDYWTDPADGPAQAPSPGQPT